MSTIFPGEISISSVVILSGGFVARYYSAALNPQGVPALYESITGTYLNKAITTAEAVPTVYVDNEVRQGLATIYQA
jgi:hypothetical protein